ncbi:MAG TPA: YbhN family protein [Acidimicrobiales bacterium]|nr:YbhN family protein [Acidimicrobiales bacterium]
MTEPGDAGGSGVAGTAPPGPQVEAAGEGVPGDAQVEADGVAGTGDHPGERPPPKRRGLRGRLPRPVWTVGRLLVLALLIEYLVVPQLAGPRKVIHLLAEVNPLLLLAGVGLEAAALLAYGSLTKVVLPGGERISFFTVFRIELTTLSVSHCAPGGTATGAALGYRLLTQFGAEPSDAGFALGVQGIGSAVVLNVILWIALIVSIPVWGFSAIYLLAAGVGVVLLLASSALVYLFTRTGQRAGDRLEALGARIPFVDAKALRRSFEQLAARLGELGHNREVLIRALVWATLNWLFDAASLWVFVGAFGHWVNPDGLLVAFGLANVLAVIPITPGGLGVVEAALTTLLVGFGTARGVATLGVVVYRLVQFWMPIPLGGLAYLSLQVDRHPSGRLGASWRVWRWHLPLISRARREVSGTPRPHH